MKIRPSIKKRDGKYILTRPGYGLRATSEESEYPTLKAALRAAQSPHGGYVGQERTSTPEHGPDYFGEPARYWPGVYR